MSGSSLVLILILSSVLFGPAQVSLLSFSRLVEGKLLLCLSSGFHPSEEHLKSVPV